MTFTSIAVRFWLSFASYEKPPTILCTQRAGLKHRGFPATKNGNTKSPKGIHQTKWWKLHNWDHFLGYIFTSSFHMLPVTPNQNFEIFFFSHKRDATCCYWWLALLTLSPAMGHRANLSLGYVSRSTLRMIRQRFSWPLGISLYKRTRRLAVFWARKNRTLSNKRLNFSQIPHSKHKTWKKCKQCWKLPLLKGWTLMTVITWKPAVAVHHPSTWNPQKPDTVALKKCYKNPMVSRSYIQEPLVLYWRPKKLGKKLCSLPKSQLKQANFKSRLPVADQKDVRRFICWLVDWLDWLVGSKLKLLLVSSQT